MKKFFFILGIFILVNFYSNSESVENFYNFDYSKSELKNIKKIWEFNSGILKDTQNKIVQYNDKIIHLDGYKNLYVISLIDGKKLCTNKGKKDRAPFRGVSLYKFKNNVYAVFIRQDNLQLVNIEDCKSHKLKKEIIVKNVVSPILIHNSKAIILPNGTNPQAYDLTNGELLWKVSIESEQKKF